MFLDDIETFRRVRLEVFKQKNFPIEFWDTLVLVHDAIWQRYVAVAEPLSKF